MKYANCHKIIHPSHLSYCDCLEWGFSTDYETC